MTMLKALVYARNMGLKDYCLILTIHENENKLTQELAEYVKSNALNVRFVGSLPRENVFELYTQSVLLFPSYVESFGLPLLEARLTGTPIIASDCPFSREILDGYNRAEFFSKFDYKAMGKLIMDAWRKEQC
jgi:glycosyltransferase involved in cell wall biosynthesis